MSEEKDLNLKAADKNEKQDKDISVEVAQQILNDAFKKNLEEFNAGLIALQEKYGLALQVTPAQIIVVPMKKQK